MNTFTAPFQTAMAGALFTIKNRMGYYLVRVDGGVSEWDRNRRHALVVGAARADELAKRFYEAHREPA